MVTRTPPIAERVRSVACLTADGVHGERRLQARVHVVAGDRCWTVQRYAYRLVGGAVQRTNTVNLRLVCGGAVVHVFDSGPAVVNDGRWYVHEHRTDVARGALTYARFEAWFDVPGLAQLARGACRRPEPG